MLLKINLKSADKSFRLDSMVFNLGLSESRAKAADLIKEGKVLVNSKTNQYITKCYSSVFEKTFLKAIDNIIIQIKKAKIKY